MLVVSVVALRGVCIIYTWRECTETGAKVEAKEGEKTLLHDLFCWTQKQRRLSFASRAGTGTDHAYNAEAKRVHSVLPACMAHFLYARIVLLLPFGLLIFDANPQRSIILPTWYSSFIPFSPWSTLCAYTIPDGISSFEIHKRYCHQHEKTTHVFQSAIDSQRETHGLTRGVIHTLFFFV